MNEMGTNWKANTIAAETVASDAVSAVNDRRV